MYVSTSPVRTIASGSLETQRANDVTSSDCVTDPIPADSGLPDFRITLRGNWDVLDSGTFTLARPHGRLQGTSLQGTSLKPMDETIADRRRLLFLGQSSPVPPHSGQQIRTYHTLRLLAEAFETKAVFFARRRLSVSADAGGVPEALRELGGVAVHPIPQETSRFRLLQDHLRSVLSRRAYVRWVYESADFRRDVTALIRDFAPEVVHFDSLDLMAYMPAVPADVPIVISHHNVESALLRRRADVVGGWRGAYIRHQAELTEREERRWCRRAALNLVVSGDEGALLDRISPGAPWVEFPNGVDTSSFEPASTEPASDIVFVGGHTWFPNSDGMTYFVEEILPLIRARRPDAEVTWVGRASDEVRDAFGRHGVVVTGYVEDIRPFVHGARCFIVPLRVGGGTRLKILDAWALGKAVVATSIGCEGLDAVHGTELLRVDDPAGFASAVCDVIEDDSLRRRLETGARAAAEDRFDWSVLGARVIPEYEALSSR